jgi:hypothetical protein
VPAAAVIPAPIAYIKVVAVKKLVVASFAERDVCFLREISITCAFASARVMRFEAFYFEKIRVFQAGLSLNTAAWNNNLDSKSAYWCEIWGNFKQEQLGAFEFDCQR